MLPEPGAAPEPPTAQSPAVPDGPVGAGGDARKPFLLLAIRPEDEAADDEYASLLRLGELAEADLRRVRMERGPVLAEVGDLAAYRGVILGGGPFQRSDPPEQKSPVQRRVEAELDLILDDVISRGRPFLGLCYGIGVLGTHQGGVVDRAHGEPVGRIAVTVTAAGQADPLFAGLPEHFEAFGGHKEALSVPPPHAVVLATSAACPVQAFRIGPRAYATQFHPELDSAGLQTRIDAYTEHGYFAPEEAEALKAQARERECAWPVEVLRRFVAMATTAAP